MRTKGELMEQARGGRRAKVRRLEGKAPALTAQSWLPSASCSLLEAAVKALTQESAEMAGICQLLAARAAARSG